MNMYDQLKTQSALTQDEIDEANAWIDAFNIPTDDLLGEMLEEMAKQEQAYQATIDKQ